MALVYENAWTSITMLCNEIIADLQARNTGVTIDYFDWDTHATANELPDADLVGPLAIAVVQHSVDLYAVNFSIGVSTYASDHNLFRQRNYIARIYEKMLAQETIPYWDAESVSHVSQLVMTDGSMVAPMAKAELRPWQYVQGEAMLVPFARMESHLVP